MDGKTGLIENDPGFAPREVYYIDGYGLIAPRGVKTGEGRGG